MSRNHNNYTYNDLVMKLSKLVRAGRAHMSEVFGKSDDVHNMNMSIHASMHILIDNIKSNRLCC